MQENLHLFFLPLLLDGVSLPRYLPCRFRPAAPGPSAVRVSPKGPAICRPLSRYLQERFLKRDVAMSLKEIILYVWQLPQNLLGALLSCIMAPGTKSRFRDVRMLKSVRMKGGISLGRYIIMSDRTDHPVLARHEWGHTRQSRMLGPLYLLVVGLPSLLWAIWWRPTRRVSYYWFYTERWADRLAGIRRRNLTFSSSYSSPPPASRARHRGNSCT